MSHIKNVYIFARVRIIRHASHGDILGRPLRIINHREDTTTTTWHRERRSTWVGRYSRGEMHHLSARCRDCRDGSRADWLSLPLPSLLPLACCCLYVNYVCGVGVAFELCVRFFFGSWWTVAGAEEYIWSWCRGRRRCTWVGFGLVMGVNRTLM